MSRHYIIVILNDPKHPVAFRADRIVGIPKILDGEGTIQPEGFGLKLNLNVPFSTYETEGRTVELICDNGVMDDIITRFGEDVTTYAYNVSCFRSVVTVAVNPSFYGWVFEFGGKVKLLQM